MIESTKLTNGVLAGGCIALLGGTGVAILQGDSLTAITGAVVFVGFAHIYPEGSKNE